MTWYYYTGKTVRPVPIKNGVSKSVRPGRKVEILVITSEAQALIRKGELRRTGAPKNAKSAVDILVPSKSIKDVVEKSEFASKFAEKGKTTSASIPPKTKSGKQEMTEGELNVANQGGEDPPDDDGVVEVAELPKDENGLKKKKKGRR